MQRVRIGLTGLAFVFVAVLLAAVFTSQSSDEAPITPNLIDQQIARGPAAAVTVQAADEPADPLAELGLAPGGSDANAATANQGAGRTPGT